MKFQVSKSAFQNAIVKAEQFIDKKDKGSIGKVYIQIFADKLIVSGTDNIHYISSTVLCESSDKFSFCVSPSDFIKGLNRLKDETIEVNISDKLHISQGKINIHYQISVSDDFPPCIVGEVSEISLPDIFQDAIGYLHGFIGTTNPKPFISCVWVKYGYIIAATPDTSAIIYFNDAIDAEYDFLLPKDSLKKISSGLMSDMTLTIGNSDVVLNSENEFYSCKLINDKVVDFRGTVSAVNGHAISLNRVQLLESLESATSFDSLFSFKFDKNVLSIKNISIGSKNFVDISMEIESDSVGEFCGNSAYVKQFLKFSKDEYISFVLPNGHLPCKFYDSVSNLILMPIIQGG